MKQMRINHLPDWTYARGEAINMLCTNLTFSGADVRRIVVTSAHASEGKTTISMEIMRKMAELYHSVVLVDADLRKSVLSASYDLQFSDPQPMGLAHYLAGRCEMDDVLYQTNIPGAYMVPVGRTVSNPLQLLNSARFPEMLSKLARMADYVIVDAPPLVAVIDGAQIGKSCDGALIVVEYNSVHRRELQDVKKQLEQSGCPILGVAMTKVDYSDYMSKKYYYKSYYYKSGYKRYEPYTSDASKKDESPRSTPAK